MPESHAHDVDTSATECAVAGPRCIEHSPGADHHARPWTISPYPWSLSAEPILWTDAPRDPSAGVVLTLMQHDLDVEPYSRFLEVDDLDRLIELLTGARREAVAWAESARRRQQG